MKFITQINSRRSDIDALRAIAVLAVVLFHAFPKYLPGGFTGVDIFFVISGYLITGKIKRELDKTGTFALKKFYMGRIKRLIPPLLIVLVTISILSLFALHSEELKAFWKQVRYSMSFASNFLFWKQSGYFDKSSELKPLLHIWSLSVEEQYYFIYPFLFLLMFRKISLLLMLVSISVLSFGASLYLTMYHPSAAFFLLISRFWELSIGGVITFWPTKRLNDSNWLSILGIGLIILGFVLSREQSFPGWYALLPTMGTALCIYASESKLNRKFLNHTVLQYFGLTSYSLYLWHWPLLSLSFIIYQSPSVVIKTVIILSSIILAHFTFGLVEYPLLQLKVQAFKTKKKIILTMIVTWILLLMGSTLYKMWTQYATQKNMPRVTWDNSKWWTLQNNYVTEHGCHKRKYSTKKDFFDCIDFSKMRSRKVILIGDSHAGNWSPVLYQVSKKLNLYFQSITAGSGCTIMPDSVITDKIDMLSDCKKYNHFIIDLIQSYIDRGDLLVIGIAAHNVKLQNFKQIHEQIKTIAELLAKKGAQLLLMNDIAEFKTQPTQCKKRSFFGVPEKCTELLSEQLKHRALVSKIISIKENNVFIYDPIKHYCSDKCYQIKSNEEFIYYDGDHLSISGSFFMKDTFTALLRRIMNL